MRTTKLTITARYIFPVEGPPIPHGFLTIEAGKISAIGESFEGTPDLDLGNVAITPGFVNAHTHLELSAVEVQTDRADGTENEIAWLRRVIDQRRGRGESSLRAAVARNLEASISSGTTSLADTTTANLSWNAITAAPVRAVVFSELIGLKHARAMQTNLEAMASQAVNLMERWANHHVRMGLSPHAPFSTSEWLYHRAVESNLPLSTHLAEMPEELELLEKRDGPLRRFLEDLGAWDEEWEPLSPHPIDYVRKGELRNSDWIIAHGNYLDPSDFWQLRPQANPGGKRLAVAFCPRTHARFGHAPHPYRAMLERGVIVCLGTDSLASSPSLSILDEARFLYHQDDPPGGHLLLTMATLFGAWALKEELDTGSLVPGKSADLAVIALPDREAEDPHDLLFDSELRVVGSAFEGEFVRGQWVGV